MLAPKYLDIYRELRERIETDIYPKGSTLPSEYQLVEEYGCSRNTIRRAIRGLAEDGYVQSVQGKGVVVLRRAIVQSEFTIGRIESMREAAERNGMTYYTKVISLEDDIIDKEHSKLTGFAPGTHVWIVRRVRYLDGEALILDTNWLDQSIVPEFSPELAEKSLYDYLEKDLGINIVTSLRRFTVDKCRRDDYQHLKLGDYNCVALVSCRTFNNEGVQFEYTESRHRPDRFIFFTQAKRYN